jgi:hypothetical protein
MNDGALVITRALAVYQRLTEAGIDCAIGGALALAFHTDDPRATRDIDVNVALPRAQARRALAALPDDVPWNDTHLAAIERDGQVRIQWPVDGAVPIPLDLFFAESPYHDLVAQRTIEVPLRDRTVRIVSSTDLTVFKALFDRSKDWPDIEAMLDARNSSVDLDEAIGWVAEFVGDEDPRTTKLRALQRDRNRR